MVQKHDSIILLVDKVLYPLGPLNAIYKTPANAAICQGTSSGSAGFGWILSFLTENLGWSKMSKLLLFRGSSYGFCIRLRYAA